MLACREGKAKKVDVLLTHPGIDVNAARAQVMNFFWHILKPILSVFIWCELCIGWSDGIDDGLQR